MGTILNLAPPESSVVAFAEAVFGNDERARSWMGEPNPALGGLTPEETLRRENGERDVIDTLGRIRFGVLS
jgi:putative toxin-antitoxin system antitoxin component (TIGR02293 family)